MENDVWRSKLERHESIRSPGRPRVCAEASVDEVDYAA